MGKGEIIVIDRTPIRKPPAPTTPLMEGDISAAIASGSYFGGHVSRASRYIYGIQQGMVFGAQTIHELEKRINRRHFWPAPVVSP